jgi:hypothetical protein
MAKRLARPIRNKRDHKAAASLAHKAHQQAGHEPEAEQRLQALLSEMEKFDEEGEEQDYDEESPEEVDSEFRRRWSDEA